MYHPVLETVLKFAKQQTNIKISDFETMLYVRKSLLFNEAYGSSRGRWTLAKCLLYLNEKLETSNNRSNQMLNKRTKVIGKF